MKTEKGEKIAYGYIITPVDKKTQGHLKNYT